jgi:PHD/YefM family antitoxin component YafN of YafNO toxin-antitoxin module
VKNISISRDIVPIAEFKTSIAKWFRNLHNTRHPLIITQNGKPAGVLMTPEEFDELVYQKAFLDSLGRGISDAENGRVYDTREVKAVLAGRRKKDDRG